MPSPKKGSDAEKPQGTLKLARPRKSGLPTSASSLSTASRDLPPLGRPVTTAQYGIVVFIQVTGELVEPSDLMASYPNAMRRLRSPSWLGHGPHPIRQERANFARLVAAGACRTEVAPVEIPGALNGKIHVASLRRLADLHRAFGNCLCSHMAR